MTAVKLIVTALVGWVITWVSPYLTSFGLSDDLVNQLSLAIQAGLVLLIAAVGVYVGKRTGLTEPASMIIAAVEAQMPDSTSAAKKAEALLKLHEWIARNVNNPIFRVLMNWAADSVIERVLPLSKTLLFKDPPPQMKAPAPLVLNKAEQS
jgi:hypothetical protein